MVFCYADEDRTRELDIHIEMRKQARRRIQAIHNQVEMHVTLVTHYGYAYPAGSGEEYLWGKALAASRALLDMIPPYPIWYTEDTDGWNEPEFWAHRATE